MSEKRTLWQIICSNWLRSGGTGDPPDEYVMRWRREHPKYGGPWPLGTCYRSGRPLQIGVLTSLDMATAEFKKRHPGHRGAPSGPEFEELVMEFRDRDARTMPPEFKKEPDAEYERDRRVAAREYQESRNSEAAARGEPLPFEEWWNDTEE